MQKFTFTLTLALISLGLFAQLDVGENIALGKEAVASSEESPGMAPSFAIDGNYGTRWASLWNGAEDPDDEWIYVDLEDRYGIDTLIFHWQSPNSKAAEASIQGSFDGQYWFDLQHFVKDHALLSDTILLADTVRYIKMHGIQRSNVWGYSIYEFEVYAFSEVTALYLDSIAITPDESEIDFGQTLALSVGGFDQNEDAFAVGTVEWSVDNGGTIDQNGVFTANKIGDFKVTAITDNVSDTALISVTSDSPIPTTLLLTPEKDTIYELGTTTLTATVYDQDGNVLSETVEYSTEINEIDASGVFTGTYTGQYTVTATLDFQIGSVEATLTDEAIVAVYPTSTVNIALDYESVDAESALTPAWMGVDDNLGTRWESAHGVDGLAWVVKLDTIYDLGAAKITWQNARAQSYNIEISNDSTNWETIYRFNPDDTTRTSGADTYDSVPLYGSAQYVKMYGISRITMWGYSFWDFELFEAASSTTVLNTIEVSPATKTIDEGEDLQLTAEGFDVLGNSKDTVISWSVVEAGAIISDNGLFSSTTAGVYTVNATSGSVTGSAIITVNDASVVTTIEVTPALATIFANETQQYSAVAYDQFGQEIAASFVWSAESGSVSVGGLYTPSVVGDFEVYAVSGSVTGTADITIKNIPALNSIEVSPSTAVIPEGGSQTFTATGYDQYGEEFAVSVTWSANVGTIDPTTGEYTHDNAGDYTVTATSGLISGTADISVSDVPELATIVVTPEDASIMEGETQQYSAVGYDQFDDEFAATFTWSADGGTIDPSTGFYTGSVAGDYEVTATSGSITGTVDISVAAIPVITTIVISPETAEIEDDETQQFTAVAYDQFDDVISATFTWSATSGTIDGTGLFTPSALGDFKVYAESGSVKDSADITVIELPVLTSIVVSPESSDINEDETQQFAAVAYDQFDDEFTTTFTWSASSGSVDATGLFTPSAAGDFKVYAESGSVKDSADITVIELPVLTTIVVSPESAEIDEDKTQQFTAVAYDQFGDEFTAALTWSATSGSVDASGLYTPSAVGNYKVYAQSGSVKDSADVTVVELPVLTTIVVSPESVEIDEDGTQQFTAVAYDQFDDEFTTTFTWTATGGSIDATGLFTPSALGDFKVYAESNSVKDSADVKVVEEVLPVVTSIVVSPATASISDNETQQLTAVAYDQNGTEIETTITWSATTGTVDANGLFTPSAAGEATISAKSGDVVGTAVITITETLVLTTLEISPDAASVYVGETQQFTAVGYDQNSDVIEAEITYSVVGGGSITEGLYTANAAGIDTVYATSGAVSSYAIVTVELPNSITDANSINVKMYPNPVSTLLTIDLAEHACRSVALISTSGQIVYKQTDIQSELSVEIDVQDLPSGIYLVVLDDEVTSYTYSISIK